MKTKGFCFQLPLINIRRESVKMNCNRRKIVGVSFSDTRGEGFGKLHIKVLLTQGYSFETFLISLHKQHNVISLSEGLPVLSL